MDQKKTGYQKLDEDYALLLLGVDELETYLLSGELYWPLFTNPKMKLVNPRSRLTPGNLLLSIQCLSSTELDDGRRSIVDAKITAFEKIRKTWKSHWLQKAQMEYHARLDLWMAYLQDLLAERELHIMNYTYAVRWRVILQLLGKEGITLSDTACGSLLAMDETLKVISQPANFIWWEPCQNGFSESDYWFLYRRIKE
jgi:hypothetical protein